jgi:hypothetical protein
MPKLVPVVETVRLPAATASLMRRLKLLGLSMVVEDGVTRMLTFTKAGVIVQIVQEDGESHATRAVGSETVVENGVTRLVYVTKAVTIVKTVFATATAAV